MFTFVIVWPQTLSICGWLVGPMDVASTRNFSNFSFLYPGRSRGGVTAWGSFPNKLNKQMSQGQNAIGTVEVVTV